MMKVTQLASNWRSSRACALNHLLSGNNDGVGHSDSECCVLWMVVMEGAWAVVVVLEEVQGQCSHL